MSNTRTENRVWILNIKVNEWTRQHNVWFQFQCTDYYLFLFDSRNSYSGNHWHKICSPFDCRYSIPVCGLIIIIFIFSFFHLFIRRFECAKVYGFAFAVYLSVETLWLAYLPSIFIHSLRTRVHHSIPPIQRSWLTWQFLLIASSDCQWSAHFWCFYIRCIW